ncbi:uncharacterized protein ACA1_182210 [Acanthamoeba castellanii str. Neff]|uniref:PAS domain-containing protein n=1 Tax=Acanthamoeba castellanii (strain ATCC 30010 / Neff) TaxID=1257118 RepID=L8H829_ACACF|nr:uncharacterized protein ACA1_182210 [Acanthamoeba castellanii str. Neff]ELR21320.1 hypothetical protein ACA1_182210 [Acanthamoeba castellanii str. Neff]
MTSTVTFNHLSSRYVDTKPARAAGARRPRNPAPPAASAAAEPSMTVPTTVGRPGKRARSEGEVALGNREGDDMEGESEEGDEGEGESEEAEGAGDGGEGCGDGEESAVAMLARAVQMLTSEVKNLRLENQQLWSQMAVMQDRQIKLDRAMAALSRYSDVDIIVIIYNQHIIHSIIPYVNITLNLITNIIGNQQQLFMDERWRREWEQLHEPAFREFSPATTTVPSVAKLMLEDLRRDLPFLRQYALAHEFAVPGPGYPMVAGTMSSVFDNKPPVIVFVNQAMAQLTQYSWHELLGKPMSTIAVFNEAALPQLTPILTKKAPMSESTLHRFNHLFRTRSGRLLRIIDNTQFFFDHDGNVTLSLTHSSDDS